MIKKYKAIKVSPQGFLTNEAGDPILCPIRNANCNLKCSWISVEDRVIYCRDMVIGALRAKPMRSFYLYTGPGVYDLDESLRNNGTNS